MTLGHRVRDPLALAFVGSFHFHHRFEEFGARHVWDGKAFATVGVERDIGVVVVGVHRFKGRELFVVVARDRAELAVRRFFRVVAFASGAFVDAAGFSAQPEVVDSVELARFRLAFVLQPVAPGGFAVFRGAGAGAEEEVEELKADGKSVGVSTC